MNMNSYSCCSPKKQEFKQINSLSGLLKLVGETNRLQILCILRQGNHCVCEINKHIKVSQSLTSHHLKDLKTAGLLTCEKRGLNAFYSLTPVGKRITNAVFNIIVDKEVAKR